MKEKLPLGIVIAGLTSALLCFAVFMTKAPTMEEAIISNFTNCNAAAVERCTVAGNDGVYQKTDLARSKLCHEQFVREMELLKYGSPKTTASIPALPEAEVGE